MPALDILATNEAFANGLSRVTLSDDSKHHSCEANGSAQHHVEVDGESLSILSVISVSINGLPAELTRNPAILSKAQASVDCLEKHIQAGKIVYGVNTGFGGSADTRTSEFEDLQIALQQHLNVGILVPSDKETSFECQNDERVHGIRGHALPVPIVKAMMLIRCNSLMRGHSGVRISTIEAIMALLKNDMTPVVPLRGSISASGDLSSLSYIAGALEGNPDVFVRVGASTIMSADQALKRAGLQPTRLMAKEGLGIMNGTATSCGAACIAIHQARRIAALGQALTAMGTEALLGTADNYHPFISTCRPHSGQREAAANILAFLANSVLASTNDPHKAGLAQDRYALRTAPQWIGPQLEDLQLAARQVQAEINSTTDNPLIDVEASRIHHGGNFQAVAITSAMEKTTTAMQMIGKLLYAQSSELINNQLNKGLPPNLSADDPSLSFTFKGFDVNMAAYMSELAYLAHPVSAHVQVTEMNNQSVNSLALVAARYTLEAVEIVSLMAATYIYALCQALDLRSLHIEFVKTAESRVCDLVRKIFEPLIVKENLSPFTSKSWGVLLEKWNELSHLDLQDRGITAARESIGSMLESLLVYQAPDQAGNVDYLRLIERYRDEAASTLSEAHSVTRKAFFVNQTTLNYVGEASKAIYRFVRQELKVPMHRGLVDHPAIRMPDNHDSKIPESPRKILGTYASEIYMSLRDGRLHECVQKALNPVTHNNENGSNGKP